MSLERWEIFEIISHSAVFFENLEIWVDYSTSVFTLDIRTDVSQDNKQGAGYNLISIKHKWNC